MKNKFMHSSRWVNVLLLAALVMLAVAMPLSAQRTGRTGVQAQPQEYTLTVNRSPGNARIAINGEAQRGNRFVLPAGRYTITVEADGYVSETRQVVLDRTLVVTFELERQGKQPPVRTGTRPERDSGREAVPPPPTVPGGPRVVAPIPGNVPGVRGGDRQPDSRRQNDPGTLIIEFPDRLANAFFYINGQRQSVNSRRAREELQLSPGTYLLRLEVGGLSSPEMQVQIEAGRTLRLVPTLLFEAAQ